MLLTILQHTPVWVYILLVVLMALGIQQSRTRRVSKARLLMLPLAMVLFSIYGVISDFGIHLLPLLCWLSGLATTVTASHLISPSRLQYCSESQHFTLPGSWKPLILIMAIFLMKYGIGVTLARAPDIAAEPTFIFTVATLNGVFSGLFLARVSGLFLPGKKAIKKPA